MHFDSVCSTSGGAREEKKKSTRHPKLGACERRAIYRLTPVRETALSSCLGSALHTGEKGRGGGEEGRGTLSINTKLKVTQSVYT